jgi:hypothetical protein
MNDSNLPPGCTEEVIRRVRFAHAFLAGEPRKFQYYVVRRIFYERRWHLEMSYLRHRPGYESGDWRFCEVLNWSRSREKLERVRDYLAEREKAGDWDRGSPRRPAPQAGPEEWLAWNAAAEAWLSSH